MCMSQCTAEREGPRESGPEDNATAPGRPGAVSAPRNAGSATRGRSERSWLLARHLAEILQRVERRPTLDQFMQLACADKIMRATIDTYFTPNKTIRAARPQ